MVRLPTAYFPPISWFHLAQKNEGILLEAHESFQKSTIRNRCFIATAAGVQVLSIPLLKGKNKQLIQDVQIAYHEPWQRTHWRTIKTAYNNSPFFEHFEPYLAPLFEKEVTFLFDFNLQCLEALQKMSRNKLPIQLTETFELQSQDLDARSFFQKKIILPDDYTPAYYPQVFEDVHGFLPDLSVLDRLFCMGDLG